MGPLNLFRSDLDLTFLCAEKVLYFASGSYALVPRGQQPDANADNIGSLGT
jgi:hypothetical protein